MNQYELALVVNAKIEDEARVATVEKVKEYKTNKHIFLRVKKER